MKPLCQSLGTVVLTAAILITNTTLSLAESAAIPLDQLGAVARKQYQGDGLSVTPAPQGARLRCALPGWLGIRARGDARPPEDVRPPNGPCSNPP